MTAVSLLVKRAGHVLKNNSPVILTAMGVTGTFTTAYLAVKSAREHERFYPPESNEMPWQDEVKLVWKLYIPPAISAAITVGAIVGASKASARQTAVVTAAYTITEKAFDEYKEKVIEKFGENKEQAVRDEIAQDRVNNTPGQNIIVSGAGNVLCFEEHTGRYFQADMETLRKAQNTVNAKMMSEMWATLSDFYYLIGLPQTTYSSDMGWTDGRLLELQFSTVMSEDQRPCIAFEYNYIKPLD